MYDKQTEFINRKADSKRLKSNWVGTFTKVDILFRQTISGITLWANHHIERQILVERVLACNRYKINKEFKKHVKIQTSWIMEDKHN